MQEKKTNVGKIRMTTRIWLLYVINYVTVPHQTAAIQKRYETKLKILAQIRTLLLGLLLHLASTLSNLPTVAITRLRHHFS